MDLAKIVKTYEHDEPQHPGRKYSAPEFVSVEKRERSLFAGHGPSVHQLPRTAERHAAAHAPRYRNASLCSRDRACRLKRHQNFVHRATTPHPAQEPLLHGYLCSFRTAGVHRRPNLLLHLRLRRSLLLSSRTKASRTLRPFLTTRPSAFPPVPQCARGEDF